MMKLKTTIAVDKMLNKNKEPHVEKRDSGDETIEKEKVAVDYVYYEQTIFKVTKYIEKIKENEDGNDIVSIN